MYDENVECLVPKNVRPPAQITCSIRPMTFRRSYVI